jgi:hypothetical protein
VKNKINKIVLEKFEPPRSLAGLQRSKKIIRAEILKEAQFAKICAQIRLEDFKKLRAEKKTNERIAKRA